MKFSRIFLLLTLVCVVFCSESEVHDVEKENEEVNHREAKQLRKIIEDDGWRVVDYPQDTNGWFPKEGNLDQIPRRRRIRKRKRRLQEEEPRRKRPRPHTLADIDDAWPEIEEEARRPSSRRRTTPIYFPEVVTESVDFKPLPEKKTELKPIYEKVRDPFTALEEAEAKTRNRKQESEKKIETSTVSHLKAILKQSGSLSLSELLQQKNLSLDDLLKGKQDAIAALTEKPETVTQVLKEEVSFKREDIRSSTSTTEKIVTKAINRHYEVSEEEGRTRENMDIQNIKSLDESKSLSFLEYQVEESSREKLDTQRSRLSLLHNDEGVKVFPSKKFEIVTEPITERRIFVPSNSKYYSSYTYKPLINTTGLYTKQSDKLSSTTALPANTTYVIVSTTTRKRVLGNKYLAYRSKYVSAKPKVSLPITSAKLNELVSRRTQQGEITTSLPSSAFTISFKNLFGVRDYQKQNDSGPMKISFDMESLINKSAEKSTTYSNKMEITIDKMKKLKDKLIPTSAREEIMVILQDHVSRQNLSRILEMRNMTIEELVAQRERGSSQLHLADIFHNQTREPEPPNEPYVGHIRSVTNPFVERKPKAVSNPIEIKKDLQGLGYIASIKNLKPLHLNYHSQYEEEDKSSSPDKPTYTVTSFPTYKIEMEKIKNTSNPLQHSIWRDLYPSLYGYDDDYKPPKLYPSNIQDILESDVSRIEEVENSISEAVNGRLNIEMNENNYEDVDEESYIPKKVKSTIIASTTIICISVFVFLTVFVIFKWLQKQKKRLCYTGSFSCSKIRSPILNTRPRRTIKTIMCETLGRRRKYSNVYPQSMSDYNWENDKKPFQ